MPKVTRKNDSEMKKANAENVETIATDNITVGIDVGSHSGQDVISPLKSDTLTHMNAKSDTLETDLITDAGIVTDFGSNVLVPNLLPNLVPHLEPNDPNMDPVLLKQQLQSQSQSNQNLQLVLNSILKKKKPIPAFLNKLYAMVSEPETNEYIHWSRNGTCFVVENQSQFCSLVLPKYFKHNNFTSFIRQLNMYGFHKIQSINQGSLSNPDQVLEFSNDYFIQDRPDLLSCVVRRKGTVVQEKETVDYSGIAQELSFIQRQQLSITTELAKMQRDHQLIWQQSMALQEQYDKQKDTIEKIVGFLGSVFQKKNISTPEHKKRKLIMPEDLQSSFFDLIQPENEPILTELLQEKEMNEHSIFETRNQLKENPIFESRNQLTEKVDSLSQDIDLLQDRIYDLGQMSNLEWDVGMEDNAVLSEDFDFDSFFNQEIK